MKSPSSKGFNLDRFCAEQGHSLAGQIIDALADAKKTENFIMKALAVLQEQGLYAYILFCRSQGDSGAMKLLEVTKTVLSSPGLNFIRNGGDLLEEIRRENGLASDLDKLLLACRILEQTFIYARYHAKALNKGTPSGVAG